MTQDPWHKVPPRGLEFRIFTSSKNPLTSSGFEPGNLASRGEHITPRPLRPTSIPNILGLKIPNHSSVHSIRWRPTWGVTENP